MIKTIAIIGATEKNASALAEGLATNCNRLLLLADQKNELSALRDHILMKNPSADIEISECSTDASWQADIIVLAVCSDLQRLISGNISGVVTQKTLIAFVESQEDVLNKAKSNALQELLPHTHVVSVFLTEDQDQEKLFYASALNEDALEEAKSLLISAGFNTELSKQLNN